VDPRCSVDNGSVVGVGFDAGRAGSIRRCLDKAAARVTARARVIVVAALESCSLAVLPLRSQA
jgi:hypothetical protein